VGAGIPVLGVCLGSQLIASALGARVYPNTTKEIGWYPVRASETPDGVLRLPDEVTVFHWHGETFDLPDGAVRLASSEACLNQTFQVGPHVIGLQFHLEMRPADVAALAEHCRDELVPTASIQSADVMLSVDRGLYDQAHAIMENVLEYLTRATLGTKGRRAEGTS
jgi:GMP synthase-like glutamine amidotransferase